MTGPTATRRGVLGAGAAAATAGALPAAAAPGRLFLSQNENAFGPSPRVAPAIQRVARGIERYVTPAEVDALSRQIAALEGVSPDLIVLGEVLEPLGLFLARSRPGGGDVVYSAPGYTALIDASAPLGGRGVPIPLNRDLQNDLPALARAMGPRTLALSLVNPHIPSGTVNDRAVFDRFIIDASRKALVVVDEAYLEYDDLPGRSAIRHLRAGHNVLVFRTMAKAYGLAGLSFGYAVAPAALARDLRASGIGAPHAQSRLALAATAAALGDQAYITRIAGAVARERARYHALIDERGWPRTDSRANFVFFRPPDAAGLRRALDTEGITIGRPFAPLDDWLRISIGRPVDNDRVLAILRRFADGVDRAVR